MLKLSHNFSTEITELGALSKRTEVNIETIRYYERIGILPKPPRSAGGHRLYAEYYQWRLVFVRRHANWVSLLSTCARFFGSLKSITEKHSAEIRWKVNELKRLERVLSAVVAQCGDDTSDCRILDALAT